MISNQAHVSSFIGKRTQAKWVELCLPLSIFLTNNWCTDLFHSITWSLCSLSCSNIFECSLHYAIWFKPNPSFEIRDINKIHTDIGSAFKSAEFISDYEQHGIKVTFATPRHQEMNGICERAWASKCDIAFSSLVHARIGYEYYSFELEHAWKVHACLPIKSLLKNDVPINPYKCFFGTKPRHCRFGVFLSLCCEHQPMPWYSWGQTTQLPK